MNFYVVDQNWFRTDDFVLRLDRADGIQYVITDTALLEMFKGQKWEYTSSRSLKAAADHPERIEVAEAPCDILKKEVHTRAPIPPNAVISKDLTTRFRLYLAEMKAQGTVGPRHDYIRRHISQAQMDLTHQQLDHPRNLAMLRNCHDSIKSDLGEEFVRAARKGELDQSALEQNVIVPAMRSAKDILAENGVTKDEMKNFLLYDSFLIRHGLAYLLLALRWVTQGGIDSLPDVKATNDLRDMEYVLIASYGVGILTTESKVDSLLADLRKCLAILASAEPTTGN